MKSLLLRRRMAILPPGLLPTGYTQVEYIQNTSNAYINTGVKATGTTRFMFHFIDEGADGSNSTRWIFGCTNLVSLTGTYFIGMRSVYNNHYGRYATVEYNLGNISKGETIINLTGNVLQIKVGASSYNHTFDEATFTSTGTIILLANTQNYRVVLPTHGKILSATIDDVRNFVPCIDPNNVVGLFDTIGRRFYSSPNGTAFVAGPSV